MLETPNLKNEVCCTRTFVFITTTDLIQIHNNRFNKVFQEGDATTTVHSETFKHTF